nr:hypothetical protein [Tanacetum cinerariifolium]
MDREIMHDLEREVGYGITDSWDEIVETLQGAPVSTDTELDIALGPRYEVGESSSATAARSAGGFRVDYGFVATIDREIMHNPEREGQQGLAGDPTQPELLEEAGGSA